MVPFDMPLDAKLALAKISVIYEREVGNKVKMSRDEDIVSLINYAVDSFNEEIIRYLDTFTRLLGPSELRALVAQGANIYRGALVPEADASTDNPDLKQGEGVKMYRGSPVSGGEPSRKKPDATAAQDKAKGVKARRIYRGRVIED